MADHQHRRQFGEGCRGQHAEAAGCEDTGEPSLSRQSRHTSRPLIYWSAGIVLLAVVTLLGLDRHGVTARSYGTVDAFGAAGARVDLVDSGVDAYWLWKKQRMHGRQILFLAGEWERVDPDSFFEVPDVRSYPLDLFTYATAVEKSALDRTTFLFAATVNGIARELYVVLPEQRYATVADNARGAKNARFANGILHLTYHGLPRTFATLDHLPQPAEAVALYVGASFFRYHTPDEVYRKLSAAGIRTDSIILSAMRDDPQVTGQERESLAEFARRFGGGGR